MKKIYVIKTNLDKLGIVFLKLIEEKIISKYVALNIVEQMENEGTSFYNVYLYLYIYDDKSVDIEWSKEEEVISENISKYLFSDVDDFITAYKKIGENFEQGAQLLSDSAKEAENILFTFVEFEDDSLGVVLGDVILVNDGCIMHINELDKTNMSIEGVNISKIYHGRGMKTPYSALKDGVVWSRDKEDKDKSDDNVVSAKNVLNEIYKSMCDIDM